MISGLFDLAMIAPFFFAMDLFAQEKGELSGRIVDNDSKEPLVEAYVAIEGTSLGGLSNGNGNYRIRNISPGTYKLKASLLGYGEVETINVVVHPNKNRNVNFSLMSDAILSGAIQIVAEAASPENEKDILPESYNTDMTPETQKEVELGYEFAKQEQWDLAIQHLEGAQRISPYEPTILYSLGLANEKAGHQTAAIEWFNAYQASSPEASNLAKTSADILRLESEVELRVKQIFKQAVSSSEKILDEHDRSNVLLEIAEEKAWGGDIEGAFDLLGSSRSNTAIWRDWCRMNYVRTLLASFDLAGGLRVLNQLETPTQNRTTDLSSELDATWRNASLLLAAKGDLSGAQEAERNISSDSLKPLQFHTFRSGVRDTLYKSAWYHMPSSEEEFVDRWVYRAISISETNQLKDERKALIDAASKEIRNMSRELADIGSALGHKLFVDRALEQSERSLYAGFKSLAEDDFERLAVIGKSNPDLSDILAARVEKLAYESRLEGNLDKAKKLHDEAVRIDSNVVNLIRQDEPSGVDMHTKSEQSNPSDASKGPWVKAAEYYVDGIKKANDSLYQEAIDSFSKAIELNPDFTEAIKYRASMYGYLGSTLLKSENYRDAIPQFEKYAESDSAAGYWDLAVAYINWGTTMRKDQLEARVPDRSYVSKYEKAAEYLEKLTSLTPDVPEVWNMLGISCAIAGRQDEALAAFKRFDLLTKKQPTKK